MTNNSHIATILGLDVGGVRVGVAIARRDVRIARPLDTLEQGPDIFERLKALADEHEASLFVVGWPRGMQGQSTKQTEVAEDFASQLRESSGMPVVLQDEALTSQRAETELQSRGKPFAKGDVDALAATYILDDYLGTTSMAGGASASEASHV